jgi:phosphoglucosamine mutase
VALVGRDPRASGEFLEAAVVAGLASAGVDVIRVGVVPTPRLAFLVNDLDADLGVMLSASHNPMPDNGIKFFAAAASSSTTTSRTSSRRGWASAWTRPTGAASAGSVRRPDAVEDYIDSPGRLPERGRSG